MHIFINNHDPLNLLSNLFLGYRTVKLAASNAKEILNRSDYYKRLLESKFHWQLVLLRTLSLILWKLFLSLELTTILLGMLKKKLKLSCS